MDLVHVRETGLRPPVVVAAHGFTPSVVSGLLIGTLALGFTHLLLLFSWEWASQFFAGAVHLSERLGAVAPNPSAIVSLGMEVGIPTC